MGCLPHSRARDSLNELEEERRLAFVGITRAQERLILSKAGYRTVRGMRERTIPSPFLAELPEEKIRTIDRTGIDDLLKPFRTTDQVEFNASALLDFDGHTSNDDPDDGHGYGFHANVYDVSGRIRLTPGQSTRGLARAQPRAGFAFTSIDIETQDPLLPGQLIDYSAAVGMGVLAYDGWLGGISTSWRSTVGCCCGSSARA